MKTCVVVLSNHSSLTTGRIGSIYGDQAKDVGFSVCNCENKTRYKSLNSEELCREMLIFDLLTAYSGNEPTNKCTPETVGIMFSYYETEDKRVRRIISSLRRLINFFELELSVPKDKRTTIYKVKFVKEKNALLNVRSVPSDCSYFLAKPPKVWLNTPYMASMFTLLIRLGKIKGIANFGTYKEFEKILTDNEGPDTVAMYSILNFVRKIVKNTSHLFAGKPTFYFRTGDSGIITLCSYKSTDSVLNDRVKTLMNGENVRTVKKA